jgi:exodeoxyribonuclease VII large subunit
MARVPYDPMKSAAMRDSISRGTPPSDPALFAAEPGGTVGKPLSVRQLNALISELLTFTLPPAFFVQGEISNFRTYDRGHGFFTLKESGAEIPCIIWKDDLARLKFRPKDGMCVIARGPVKMYEPQGRIQLYVETLLPQGAGALELAFRQLCEKLKAEGLFEPARKRPIPNLPRKIVVITSRTGDVLHDVLTTAHRRYPGLHVLLYAVRVQGAQAAPEIVRAIQNINAYNSALSTQQSALDLILLVRGGGSLEDLWAFNEESVARAIVASKIPIATGIGHEPDTTIADLVGDLRGPTPTGIAELTIPDVSALSAELQNAAAIMTRDVHRTLQGWHNVVDRISTTLDSVALRTVHERRYHLDQLTKKIAAIEPRHAVAQGWRRVEEGQTRLSFAAAKRVRTIRDRIDRIAHQMEKACPDNNIDRFQDRLTQLETRLKMAAKHRLTNVQQTLENTALRLRAVSPIAVLERGYSITTDKEGNVIRSAAQVNKGDLMTTRTADGTITSTVGKPRQESLF